MRRHKHTRAPKQDRLYQQLWRVVDGAVASTFQAHPGYIPEHYREKNIRDSINRRVVGALIGFCVNDLESFLRGPHGSPVEESSDIEPPAAE